MDKLELDGKFLVELSLRDPRAIDIVEKLPLEQRDTVLEKYIILGDMVVSHANISTSKETVENFFDPLKQDIERIREALNKIVPTMATPSLKGDITVGSIYESLKEHFMDDSFEDVSKIGKFSDILAKVNGTIPVLIELKDYRNAIPSAEVEKFWRDMEVHDANYGIFVSMRTDITGCSTCISMKKQMNRTGVFVVDSDLNWKGHLFSFYIVKKLVESEGIKPKDLSMSQYEKKFKKIFRFVNEIQELENDIDEINKHADDLKNYAASRASKISGILNTYKTRINEKINLILKEYEEASDE